METATLATNLNFVWVMVCAALVFLMQAGFMCLEAGLAAAKHSINVAIKNLADFVIAAILFWMVGFGIMFGDTQGGWFGWGDFFINVDDPWRLAFFVFQAVFVGTAATIDSGAIAGRAKFRTYLIISGLISAVIYPVFGHWAWGGLLHDQAGWLEARGFKDFAGSTVVHSVGGWTALVGVMVVGPRIGKFKEDGTPQRLPPHSMTMAVLGAFILFFGWFGFNCGSTLEATPDIAIIAMNTLIAACFACLAASAISWVLSPLKRPEVEMVTNGLLGGLVGITAGCAFVDTMGAMWIGLGAGVVVYIGIELMEKVFKLDDVVGAVSVHGFCGAWGTLALGLLILPEHLGELSRFDQISVQFLGVLVCFLWTFGVAFLVIKGIDITTGGMRVSREDEIRGLNVAEHGFRMSHLDAIEAMHYIGKTGDLSKRVEIEIGTEMGEVAMTFNDMLDKIEDVVRVTNNVAHGDLSRSVEPKSAHDVLGHSVNDMVNSLRDFVQRIESVSGGLSGSVANLDASSQDLHDANQDLTASIEEVVSNVAQAIELAKTMSGHAGEGSDSVRQTRADLDAIREVLLKLNGQIQTLDGESEQISQFTSRIHKIANQTNLLALNAAVEAARAGEHGRGFAVVADEVKTLSGSSAKAAQEIESLLHRIRGSMGEAIAASQETDASSKNMAENTARALSESFANISRSVNAMAEMMSTIESATQRQDHSSLRSRDAVEQIGNIGRQMRDDAQQLLDVLTFFRAAAAAPSG
ncbi:MULTISPECIES: ammonium transporter [Thiorhodovibrio]|uniref:ammonium transporter n=1 Tax=Thiorhodovibrio TaxID=61593 RepID=UPI0019132611|nr:MULTISPECIES: ammonium transporter [Thiorhodovibrio]MBK5967504.1 hypothetical protein [Thiorhodovibrio winogradskyi]WPL13270.1 Ammonia transporter [Thiorhodovibrio litoralis]